MATNNVIDLFAWLEEHVVPVADPEPYRGSWTIPTVAPARGLWIREYGSTIRGGEREPGPWHKSAGEFQRGIRWPFTWPTFIRLQCRPGPRGLLRLDERVFNDPNGSPLSWFFVSGYERPSEGVVCRRCDRAQPERETVPA